MKRILRINYRFYKNKNDFDIIINFNKEYPFDFCLSIIMLEQKIIERLILLNNKKKLHFIYDDTLKGSKFIQRGLIYEIHLNQDNIGFLINYLLIYYRDEMADVSHIHIPLYNETRNTDLIIEVEKSKPPVSGEEAIKILNQYD